MTLRFRGLVFLLALVLAGSAHGDSSFVRGDVIVSGSKAYVDDDGLHQVIANIRVHGNDGVFKRELITSTVRRFAEPLVRDGIVFVGTRSPHGIARIDAAGNVLAPFTTNAVNVQYLSPGLNGGLFATNISAETYQFAADGTLLRYRSILDLPRAEGIDLGADQCTLYFASFGIIGRWNACLDTPAEYFTPPVAFDSKALRVLPDGTFLLVVFDAGSRILRLDQNANILREYLIPSSSHLALDVDGTSFWTNAGNYLLRIDIATGAVLSESFTEFLIEGIGVVGEPRAGGPAGAAAAIPTSSSLGLFALCSVLVLITVLKLRS